MTSPLNQKINFQLKYCVNVPPRKGPRQVPSPIAAAHMLIAKCNLLVFENVILIIARETDVTNAAATP